MKKYLNCIRAMLLLLLFGSYCSIAQTPAGNPYKAKYNTTSHWTDSLKWSNITDISSVSGLVKKEGKVDSVALHTLMKSVSAKGGGVVYFPAGTYSLDFHLRMFSGVVIRGADPVQVTDAKADGYSPPTRFVFPVYAKSLQKAFKRIYADTTGAENFGLINLDINRAIIAFYPGNYAPEITPAGRTVIAHSLHRNVIILGIRQNNAAIPDPSVPLPVHKKEGVNQLWPWRSGANIDVTVRRNCVIANCRLNDQVNDDFHQPGYKTNDNDSFSGEEAAFRYADHEGIVVNAYKMSVFYSRAGVLERSKRYRFLDNKKAETEPSLFAPGIEIRDNHVCAAARYGKIVASGAGIVIKDNVECNLYGNDYLIGKNGWQSQRWTKIAKSDSLFERKFFVHGRDTLRYRLMKPANVEANKKYPLVVFFCSQLEKGSDNVTQLRNFVTLFAKEKNRLDYPAYVLVPQQPAHDEWGLDIQRDTITRAMRSTVEIVKGLIKNGDVDPSRLYITGYSDAGGFAVWEMLYRFPEFNFAAAVPMNAIFDMKKNHLKEICKVPLWVALGDLDLQRAEPFLKLLRESLKKGGCDYKLSIYSDVGVDSPIGLSRDPDFLPWLFSQKNEILK